MRRIIRWCVILGCTQFMGVPLLIPKSKEVKAMPFIANAYVPFCKDCAHIDECMFLELTDPMSKVCSFFVEDEAM